MLANYRKAFDCVNHNLLWHKLNYIGMSGKLIRILKHMYDNATLRVKSGGSVSDE
uniref:Reverse transcriptase domain-containing protein n=1 Tax=Rhodnius prolixus TaxID=13249 RepID=T1H9V2_RHOPR